MLSVQGINIAASVYKWIIGFKVYEIGTLFLKGNDSNFYHVSFYTDCIDDDVICYLDKKIKPLKASEVPSTFHYVPIKPFKVTMVGNKVVDEKGNTVISVVSQSLFDELFIDESRFEESSYLKSIEVVYPKEKEEKEEKKDGEKGFVFHVTLNTSPTERISSFKKLKQVPRIIKIDLSEDDSKKEEEEYYSKSIRVKNDKTPIYEKIFEYENIICPKSRLEDVKKVLEENSPFPYQLVF